MEREHDHRGDRHGPVHCLPKGILSFLTRFGLTLIRQTSSAP
jgi:hypothetical protein